MKNNHHPIRVRFAPSPTGLTHLGSARTALYNYLMAQQTGGQFILRFEDTDQKRFDPEAEDDLINSLSWLGMSWDEGPDVGGPHAPYRQSERKQTYLDHARKLIDKDHAYYCFCSPGDLAQRRKSYQDHKRRTLYDGKCRDLSFIEARQRVEAEEPHVIRFKTPKDGTITVHDHLRGEITFDNTLLDDYIIVKSDGLALYHLASMVDDYLMDITHVFRGEEWLPTFPLHAHIYRAFGWEEPVWVHLSVFLKPSGKGKMSKRDTEKMKLTGKSIFIRDLNIMGYLPEGVVNWIALMGWSYDDHTEFFIMQDLIDKFDIDRLNPSPAAINFKKLDHFNGLHVRNLDIDDLNDRIKPYFEVEGVHVDEAKLRKITPILQNRLTTLDDAPRFADFFFQSEVSPLPEDLLGKNLTAEESTEAARQAYEILQSIPDFNHESTEPPMRALAEEMGLKAGQLFGILRVAVTGKKISPPLFESMEIIGKETVLHRIENAIILLEKISDTAT
jgi:glutamyl-tRNA synthetase